MSGGPSVEPAQAEIAALRDLMMQWVRGERSHWNTYCAPGGDTAHQLAMCAIADAQEVVKLSAAIRALAVLQS